MHSRFPELYVSYRLPHPVDEKVPNPRTWELTPFQMIIIMYAINLLWRIKEKEREFNTNVMVFQLFVILEYIW